MTKKLLFVTTILLVLAIGAFAADVSGKWTYEQPGRGGNPGRPVTITLKQTGNNITGQVPGMGRGGDAPPPPSEITNGKVDGDNITFEVTREFNGNKMTQKFEGKVEGDQIKFKITREGQNGPQVNEVVAKKTTT
jgi:hypothetical protein